jgi:hypothetical protein
MKMSLLIAVCAGLAALRVHAQPTPAVPPKPAPPPPPPVAGEKLSPSSRPPEVRAKPSVEYAGALARLRRRGADAERALARPREAVPRGYENVSFDPHTGRPQGIYLFVVKY